MGMVGSPDAPFVSPSRKRLEGMEQLLADKNRVGSSPHVLTMLQEFYLER